VRRQTQLPKKDRFPPPGEAGTELLNKILLSLSRYSISVLVEVLDQRAGLVIWVAVCLLVNIREHRAEASDCCRDSAIVTRYEEGGIGNVAPHRSEQPRRAESPEGFVVAGITKEDGQPALAPARWRSLLQTNPWCRELTAAGVQEHVERSYRGCRIQNVGVIAVPVDLAAVSSAKSNVIIVACYSLWRRRY
jgi:hypothetical protein